MLKVIDWIMKMSGDLRKNHIGAFSAQAAYFIILSFVPFVMLLMTLLKFLPISEDTLIESILSLVPVSASSTVQWLLNEILAKSSGTLLSATIVMLLWAAGKGIMALADGLNAMHNIEETRNYFVLRIVATFYTLLFAFMIILTLIFLVFGNRLFMLITQYFPFMEHILTFVNSIRSITTLLLLFLFFLLFYKVLPAQKLKFRHQIPGAAFTAAGWLVCSYIFSLYLELSKNISYMYGSLATVIVLMLWLYFCMYIMFCGAELNIMIFDKPQDTDLKY